MPRVEVTVLVGDPTTPVAAFSTTDFVYPEGDAATDFSRDALVGVEEALAQIDRAQESLRRQAAALAGALGDGPPRGAG